MPVSFAQFAVRRMRMSKLHSTITLITSNAVRASTMGPLTAPRRHDDHNRVHLRIGYPCDASGLDQSVTLQHPAYHGNGDAHHCKVIVVTLCWVERVFSVHVCISRTCCMYCMLSPEVFKTCSQRSPVEPYTKGRRICLSLPRQ